MKSIRTSTRIARDRQQRAVDALDGQRAIGVEAGLAGDVGAPAGASVGSGTILRSAVTSRTIDRCRPAVEDRHQDHRRRVVGRERRGGVCGPSVWPTSPQATPLGGPTPTRSGSASSRRSVSVVADVARSGWRPSRPWPTKAITDGRPAAFTERVLSRSCTCVDSAPRARNVSLSSAAAPGASAGASRARGRARPRGRSRSSASGVRARDAGSV